MVTERTVSLTRANENLHQEIAGRKQVEEVLAASEVLFRSIFEQAVVGIAHVNLTEDSDTSTRSQVRQ
jgi:hypothetical protein